MRQGIRQSCALLGCNSVGGCVVSHVVFGAGLFRLPLLFSLGDVLPLLSSLGLHVDMNERFTSPIVPLGHTMSHASLSHIIGGMTTHSGATPCRRGCWQQRHGDALWARAVAPCCFKDGSPARTAKHVCRWACRCQATPWAISIMLSMGRWRCVRGCERRWIA